MEEDIWAAMIQSYRANGKKREALLIFNKMIDSGMPPGEFTFSIILSVLAEEADLKEGERIHTMITVRREKREEQNVTKSEKRKDE